MSTAGDIKQSLSIRLWLIGATIMCIFSVAMGAFAAHGLKAILSPYQLDIVQTAAKYQMYHGLAILIITSLALQKNSLGYYLTLSRLGIINSFFVLGIFLFSGSLYSLALTQLTFLGIVTPVGGVLFLCGWCSFIYFLVKPKTT